MTTQHSQYRVVDLPPYQRRAAHTHTATPVARQQPNTATPPVATGCNKPSILTVLAAAMVAASLFAMTAHALLAWLGGSY